MLTRNRKARSGLKNEPEPLIHLAGLHQAVYAVETANLYKNIPDKLEEEIFELLVQGENVRIERIVSYGHRSPGTGWYDQAQNERVLVLKGNANISFENGRVADLEVGDYLNIPSHQKHKVIRTGATTESIWLVIHYR